MDALSSLEAEGSLPIRVYAMLSARDGELCREWLSKGPDRGNDRMLITRSVKAYYDGALGSRGARLLEDYSDMPGHQGTSGGEYGFDMELAAEMMRSGFQVGVHAIGDAGNRETLDFLQSVVEANPETRGLRHRIEHAQVVHPDDIPDSPLSTSSPRWSRPTARKTRGGRRLGSVPERVKGAYAWRSFRKTGARLAFNSDLAGSDHDIFYGLHSAITRRDKEQNPPDGWHPEERMTPEEALRGYTVWNAYAAAQESETGTLAPGKRADITIHEISIRWRWARRLRETVRGSDRRDDRRRQSGSRSEVRVVMERFDRRTFLKATTATMAAPLVRVPAHAGCRGGRRGCLRRLDRPSPPGDGPRGHASRRVRSREWSRRFRRGDTPDPRGLWRPGGLLPVGAESAREVEGAGGGVRPEPDALDGPASARVLLDGGAARDEGRIRETRSRARDRGPRGAEEAVPAVAARGHRVRALRAGRRCSSSPLLDADGRESVREEGRAARASGEPSRHRDRARRSHESRSGTARAFRRRRTSSLAGRGFPRSFRSFSDGRSSPRAAIRSSSERRRGTFGSTIRTFPTSPTPGYYGFSNIDSRGFKLCPQGEQVAFDPDLDERVHNGYLLERARAFLEPSVSRSREPAASRKPGLPDGNERRRELHRAEASAVGERLDSRGRLGPRIQARTGGRGVRRSPGGRKRRGAGTGSDVPDQAGNVRRSVFSGARRYIEEERGHDESETLALLVVVSAFVSR